MDVNMPSIDNNQPLNKNIYFNNSDLFSLLSRNTDILPEEFQEVLMGKEGKNNSGEKEVRVTKEQAAEVLKKNGLEVESNPYLSSLPNTHHLHSIWRKALSK